VIHQLCFSVGASRTFPCEPRQHVVIGLVTVADDLEGGRWPVGVGDERVDHAVTAAIVVLGDGHVAESVMDDATGKRLLRAVCWHVGDGNSDRTNAPPPIAG
jgi:hypothetical protein